MRWVVSILAVMTVTFLLTMFGVKSFNRFKPDDDERKTHPLEILSRSDRIDLARLLGEETGRRRPELPKLEDLPQLQIPERVSTGFVQLEVSVDADGRVSDAVVVTFDEICRKRRKDNDIPIIRYIGPARVIIGSFSVIPNGDASRFLCDLVAQINPAV